MTIALREVVGWRPMSESGHQRPFHDAALGPVYPQLRT